MNEFKLRKCFFIFLLVLALFLIGCSGNNESNYGDNSENNEITAAATAKIYRACKLPNGDFCEDACCKTNEKCNGETAYKECDLETGEWQKEYFSDSKCISKCEISENADDESQDKTALNQQICIEGWKCINKFERSYRNSDCSFGETKRCKAGCINDTCIKTCTPGNLSCRKDALQICDDNGEGWEFYMNCAYGCRDNTCSIEPTQNQTTSNSTQNNQTQNTTQPIQNTCDNACFSVTEFNYNPDGNECQSAFLNGEYVSLKNNCAFTCELTGWSISDAASHVYTFSSFSLGSGNAFTLYSGAGTDTASQLYWNSPYTPCKAIWNNDGDTLNLKNQNNELIFTYTYP